MGKKAAFVALVCFQIHQQFFENCCEMLSKMLKKYSWIKNFIVKNNGAKSFLFSYICVKKFVLYWNCNLKNSFSYFFFHIICEINPCLVINFSHISAFPGGSIYVGGWNNLSGQMKNLGQLMWADNIIYVGE